MVFPFLVIFCVFFLTRLQGETEGTFLFVLNRSLHLLSSPKRYTKFLHLLASDPTPQAVQIFYRAVVDISQQPPTATKCSSSLACHLNNISNYNNNINTGEGAAARVAIT